MAPFAVDSVQGLGEIVAFQQEGPRGDKLDALGQRHIDLRLPFFRELTAQQSLLEALTGLGGLAVVVTGAWLTASGTIQAGVLPLLTILAMAAFLPVSEIAQIGRQLADTLGSTRRVYALSNEPCAGNGWSGRSRSVWTGIPDIGKCRLPLSGAEPPGNSGLQSEDSPPARQWLWSARPARARRRLPRC